MQGESIVLRDAGGEIRAYISRPPSPSPGVIVLQEWWGLVPHITDVCDRLANEGFVALAPDLYHGKTTTEPDEAATLFQALHIGETEATLRTAILRLVADASTAPNDKVGVVGFCMGGQLALFAAGSNPVVKATVCFYGIHPDVQPSFRDLNGPVLGFFGEKDHMVTPDVVAALDEELTLLEKEFEFHTYPGASHAFFNDTRPEVYDAAAAADAWTRTVAFLKANLV